MNLVTVAEPTRGEVWTCRIGESRRPVVVLGASTSKPGRTVVAVLTDAADPPPTGVVVPKGSATGLRTPNHVRGDVHAVDTALALHRCLGMLTAAQVAEVSAACNARKAERIARGEHPGHRPPSTPAPQEIPAS